MLAAALADLDQIRAALRDAVPPEVLSLLLATVAASEEAGIEVAKSMLKHSPSLLRNVVILGLAAALGVEG